MYPKFAPRPYRGKSAFTVVHGKGVLHALVVVLGPEYVFRRITEWPHKSSKKLNK